MEDKAYLCIDLKSFYASVECVERGLDPMTANLVVADSERTDKTICLAVSVNMKKSGVKNRCRLFEIPKNIDYVIAPPRMQKYIDYSCAVYDLYLDYFSKDDVYVYSIDECFIDITPYLNIYKKTPREMAEFLLKEISRKIGIRASCGIGTNLYLTKIALDITAKKADDFIGELNQETFKETLWNHQPLTDFWRIGPGTQRTLNNIGIYTMGQIAWASEEKLYEVFGIDAELLIDHAWGIEPVTIADIKEYQPKSNSISQGQVLAKDYSYKQAEIIVKEMMDLLSLQLVDKQLYTSNISLMIGYSNRYNLKGSTGSLTLDFDTNSDTVLIENVVKLYSRLVNKSAMVRRVTVSCNKLTADPVSFVQSNLFEEISQKDIEKDNAAQKAIIEIKKRFGKDAILKGMNFEEGATTRERNHQIGGHKSGK
ncbi:MAG: DNA repair protein [Bacillota bacterium]|jgi:DNA polymerase V|nr:DNA repair protein [Bacillota bacterium]NLL26661.1 DNA repair protein [Erysipelotrichia bacterium]